MENSTNILPNGVPITFTFHGPWGLACKQKSVGKLGISFRHWIEQKVYARCDRFIVLSKANANILNQGYRVPDSKIIVIPGGDLTVMPTHSLEGFELALVEF